MIQTFFDVRDIENPVGEEKRVVALLKSFGARNATNVNRTLTPCLYEGEPAVTVCWESAHGEFKERSWKVEVIFSKEMTAFGDMARVEVSGSDLKMHGYTIPFRTLNRFLRQRLGNDYLPTLYEESRDFWINIGGSKIEGYVTAPAWVQWGLGDFGFHALRTEIHELLKPGSFLPLEEAA